LVLGRTAGNSAHLLCFFFNCKRQRQAKRFIVILWFSFWVVENYDKPPDSSSSYWFFSWVKENDDKPPNSSSFYGFFSLGHIKRQQIAKLVVNLFFLSCIRWPQASWLIIVLCYFFLSCKKNNEPRAHCHLVVFFLKL